LASGILAGLKSAAVTLFDSVFGVQGENRGKVESEPQCGDLIIPVPVNRPVAGRGALKGTLLLSLDLCKASLSFGGGIELGGKGNAVLGLPVNVNHGRILAKYY
jgi:hypothetical protein